MKLEVKERDKRPFYVEFVAMMIHYDKIKKNPKKKIYSITLESIIYCVISFLLVLFFLYLYSEKNSSSYFLYLCFCSFVFLFSIFYCVFIQIQIYKHMHVTGKILIAVDQKGINMNVQEHEYFLPYTKIEAVLIQHYGIGFLPKEKNHPFMCISKKHQEFVLKALTKYHQEKLIVDNTDLY